MFTLAEKTQLVMYGVLLIASGTFAFSCLVRSQFYDGKIKGEAEFRSDLNAALSACTTEEEKVMVLKSFGIIK